jgi:exodeoxyribonuclease VII large subunit
MNFDVKLLRLAGEGDLRLKVAQLAAKLEAEGLMDQARKRRLPAYPSRIAVVTSPRGKAIHDVLRTLRRRFPLAEVLIAGIPVEGQQAAARIIEGLKVAQDSAADVILLVRGGGSYEDLMPFNDEQLARAIAASTVPVATGIGHEPDNSIADMVADFRASTPTAAAESATPSREALLATLRRLDTSLVHALKAGLNEKRALLARLAQRPLFLDAASFLRARELQCEGTAQRMQQALPLKYAESSRFVEAAAARLAVCAPNLLKPHVAAVEKAAAQLDGLSPLAVLARGYSIAYDQNDRVVTSVDAVDLTQRLRVRLADGSLDCMVERRHHSKLPTRRSLEEAEVFHD